MSMACSVVFHTPLVLLDMLPRTPCNGPFVYRNVIVPVGVPDSTDAESESNGASNFGLTLLINIERSFDPTYEVLSVATGVLPSNAAARRLVPVLYVTSALMPALLI